MFHALRWKGALSILAHLACTTNSLHPPFPRPLLPTPYARADLTTLARIDPFRAAMYADIAAASPAAPTDRPTHAALLDEGLLVRTFTHVRCLSHGHPAAAVSLALVCRAWPAAVARAWSTVDLTLGGPCEGTPCEPSCADSLLRAVRALAAPGCGDDVGFSGYTEEEETAAMEVGLPPSPATARHRRGMGTHWPGSVSACGEAFVRHATRRAQLIQGNVRSFEFVLSQMFFAVRRLVLPLAPQLGASDVVLAVVAQSCPELSDLTLVGDAGWRLTSAGGGVAAPAPVGAGVAAGGASVVSTELHVSGAWSDRAATPCDAATLEELLGVCTRLRALRFVGIHCGAPGSVPGPDCASWFASFGTARCPSLREVAFVDCLGWVDDAGLHGGRKYFWFVTRKGLLKLSSILEYSSRVGFCLCKLKAHFVHLACGVQRLR